MENDVYLKAEKRPKITTGENNKLRLDGKIPAVLYGSGQEAVSIIVNEIEFRKIVRVSGENAVINLQLKENGKERKHPVIIKNWQTHPVKRNLLHIDFYQISLKKEVVVDVPIEIKGEAPGVKQSGGVLEHMLRNLEVKCLPSDIPHSVVIDVSNLKIGEEVTVKDLVVAKGIKILNDPEQVCLHIVAPTILEEKTEEGITPEKAEPEVIAKGKKDEEEKK